MKAETRESVYGKIPADWQVRRLQEVCIPKAGIQTGPFGSQLHQRDYQPVGTPIITVEHLGENRILHQDLPRVSENDLRRLSKYTIETGDIIFSRVGSVDLRAIVRDEEDGWLFSGRCIRVRPNRDMVSSEYLAWFFGFPVFREHIRRIAVGATMPSINTDILSGVQVILPSLAEQHAIACILGPLDDKIELNRRMNLNLEAMVQAIFKSWFVDFDPVVAKSEGRQPFGMNAETMELFPSEFQVSGDKDFVSIPVGWKLGKIGDIGENIRRGVNPDDVYPETPYIGLEHMPRKSIELSKWGRSGDVTSNKFKFKKGEILFGKLRPYFHKVGIAPIDGVCSTDILVVTTKQPEYFGVIMGHLNSVNFINYVDAGSEGTKMPRTNWEMMARYPMIIPDRKTASRFTKIVSPMVQKIHANIYESRTLANIRDALLPRLLSGDVRVKGVA